MAAIPKDPGELLSVLWIVGLHLRRTWDCIYGLYYGLWAVWIYHNPIYATVNLMNSRATFKNGHGDYTKGPTQVLICHPCTSGLPDILTVAHVALYTVHGP